MQRIGKIVLGFIEDALKFLQVEEMDHDLGLLEVINPEARPIEVKNALGHPVQMTPNWGRLNINLDSANVITLTGASQSVTVPVKGARYIMIAMGDNVYVTRGNPAAVGAAGIPCPDSQPMGPTELNQDIHIIGAAGAGFFYLIRIIE